VTVTDHVGDETWTEITSQVDGIAGLPSEASTDTEDDEEEAERTKVTSTDVTAVCKSVDKEHKESAGNELGEKLASLGHEWLRVCAENAGCCGVACDSTDARATFENVDGRLVVCVDNGRCSHGSEDLGEHVDREFSPWVLSEDAVGESDSRI